MGFEPPCKVCQSNVMEWNVYSVGVLLYLQESHVITKGSPYRFWEKIKQVLKWFSFLLGLVFILGRQTCAVCCISVPPFMRILVFLQPGSRTVWELEVTNKKLATRMFMLNFPLWWKGMNIEPNVENVGWNKKH